MISGWLVVDAADPVVGAVSQKVVVLPPVAPEELVHQNAVDGGGGARLGSQLHGTSGDQLHSVDRTAPGTVSNG